MKVTRYLWINSLPKHCQENHIQSTFQSHGKIQTIRIQENKNCRGAIVAFIDCKSSTKAFESVKTLMNMSLKLEYCEANGEPGIMSLGLSNESCSGDTKVRHRSGSNKTSDSRSRSSCSNTSSFGSSLDDCAKYPPLQVQKRPEVCGVRSCSEESGEKRGGTEVVESGEGGGGPGTTEGPEGLHEDMRGLLVENLSQRSSDTSLREGLFHEYKKHGKITSVAVMGQGGARHAVISFKRPEDMAKALEASASKTFFGQLIKVRQHHGYNYVDPDLCPPEHAMDEYHPKATKTLFVGKLCTGSVLEHDLAKVFRKYGDIIDVDIKTQSNQPDTSFAFVQYFDISSVVRALRNQDSIKVDGKPVKLGFGKSQPANCLWVGNLQRNANDTFLRRHFKRYGAVMLVIPDQEYNCALVQFEAAEDALRAFTDTRERYNSSNVPRRMQVDYASNEYQMAFMNRLRKSCQFDTQDFLKNITDPYQTEKIQNLLISYTKYLGLLDETRTRAYDRYEPKSDYEDYDDCYNSRPSRQRKNVHQRLYNESYGVDEEYSDDYHYSKQKSRHLEEYSPSRSPARYPRPNQKYINDQYGPQDSRRSNYQHYSNDYYESKVEPSSSTFYPYRRSQDPNFAHSNHNRSYSPSPTSSIDYCDDYPRYNLSPKRYSRSNKEYHISRSRLLDVHDTHEEHFDRTSETKSWLKPLRRDIEDFTAFRSKSKSKLSTSVSPHLKNASVRLRTIKNDVTKRTRIRRSNNKEEVVQIPSVSKVEQSTNNIVNKVVSGNVKTKTNGNGIPTNLPNIDTVKLPTEVASIPSVVQPVDALSKLERERAKLLEELSLLSEDTLGTPTNLALKTVKSSPKILHEETITSQKKVMSPQDTSDKGPPNKSLSSPCVMENKIVKTEKVVVKIEPKVPEIKLKLTEIPIKDKKILHENSPPTSSSLLSPCVKSSMDSSQCHIDGELTNLKSDVPLPETITVITTTSSLQSLDLSNLPRDPRLNSSSYYIRPLSISSISPTNLLLPVISTVSISDPIVIPVATSCSYKDSTSDSDMDPFSNTDFDVDKRIRELDAKISRNEQTVRTLDYSKFRIRKKDSGSLTCVTTTVSVHSSPSYLISPSNSMVSSSSLLDVGYSTINRDSGSNTSEFIKSMLNQTKQKSYHLLSDSGTDHIGSLCSNYSIVSTTCSSLPFRTIDLGANDIERRTFYSRYGSTTLSSSPYVDSKLNVDTSMLSPTFSLYTPKLQTTIIPTITSSKVSASLEISPTTLISTVSAPNTPNTIDSNQPMKSILKKSCIPLHNPMIKPPNKLPDSTVVPKMKMSQDAISSSDCISNKSNDPKEIPPKKSSTVTLKRKSEDDDSKKHLKRIKNDNGPVLDDTLFQSYPTMPTKKVKKSIKKPSQPLLEVKPPVTKKLALSPNPSTSEKHIVKKTGNQNNKKLSKSFTENQNTKLSANKKSKLKQKSTTKLTQSQIRNGKSKSNKSEKSKKITKCKKERLCYESRLCEEENDKELEEEMNRFSENEDDNGSETTDSDDYESMYDKIKRRKSKSSKMMGEMRRKQALGKKRRNNNNGVEYTGGSSDNLDSENSEYWSVKSNKRLSHQKRKRPRMSDLSSSHFSDSNSCKTTPCGKQLELQHSSEKHDAKDEIKINEDNIKDESVTDESKAPAESFNLSSPHNSSQCSSPKYIKEVPIVKGVVASSCVPDHALSQGAQSFRGRSLHRPNDGPLKKRPITEPIVLSEDLPFLEKQADEEYIVSSPTSFNDEPPSQLESMYDLPSSHQTNVLEEIVLDDHHHSSDVVDVEYSVHETIQCDTLEHEDSILPSDVDSASHILLTMKSQPGLEVKYASTAINNEPDHQLQSVAEHLISLAQNNIEGSINIPCESPISIHEEDKVEPNPQVVETMPSKSTPNVKQDDEVTIYVKNIIDRIKQETDLASTLNKEKLAFKRAKKANTFNIPLSKLTMVSNVSQDCRHILPLDSDTISRWASATITTTQPLSLGTVASPCVMITNNQIVDQSIHYPKSQSSRSSQGEEKRSIHSDEANSTCSTEKRMRHNSAKSDGQLQSLDETIDNVVKGSISSSVSDALSIKSATDLDESKSLSNSYESITMIKGDFSSLEETMNEVINKVNVPSTSTSVMPYMRGTNELENGKCHINAVRPMLNNEINRQKKITMNHMKPSLYQLTNNVGGITNLVLGIPSILTVNALVSQQNALNHMVSFQNSVSGQNKLSNQLTLPLNKVSVSSLQCNATSSGSSQVIQSLSLTPSNINIQSLQQHNQNPNLGVQSTDMVFTKLNSLTPIMIQAPLRSITSFGQNNNMLNQSVISNRPGVNTMNATFVSIAAGTPGCNISTDTSCSKFFNVSLTPSLNKPITTPINVVPRVPLTTQGLNLAKISTASLDPNYYLMMQRQTNQSKPKSSTDVNVSGLTAGHSIILSQLSHSVNSVLSPITPGYLTASMNRPNSSSISLQPLSTSNGIVTANIPTASILFRPLSIPFKKFEERDDWLKQSTQSEFNYPIRWTGKLCLKNDEVFVQMHMLAGNEDLIRNSMNLISAGQDFSQPLRIVQRMRLEPNQLEGLQRRLARQLEFCTCLTLAGGDKPDELGRTSLTLKDNFINYLREKSAAGIINICMPDSQQNAYVIHIFPPCDFSDNQLRTCSSKLYEKLKEQEVPYLVIVITTV